MSIGADQVKALRDQTGAGMMECKKALMEADGDAEKAVVILRERGLAAAAKRADRATREGVVGHYIHPGGKLGVLVEVNCETDFVAKNPEFQDLVNDIAMQIAASSPLFVRREEVTPEEVEKEKQIYRNQAAQSGKPDRIIEKIVDGKLDKFFSEVCLYEQPFIKDPDQTIEDLIKSKISKIKENISVKQFARFKVGE